MKASAKAIERSMKRSMGYGDISRPKPKKKRKKSHWPKGVSDTLLQDLWRKQVRKEWGGRCPMAYLGGCSGLLECHHVKPRRITHLRHVPANGILLCQHHHSLSSLRVWRLRIESAIGEDTMEYLDALEALPFPEYLRAHGQTKAEYMRYQKDTLTLPKDTA